MVNFLFLIAIIGVTVLVVLPFVFMNKKPTSIQPGIAFELLPPGYRRYTISVPDGYTGEKSVPLILALHYAGHGIPFYGEMILQEIIKPAFGELDPIIVSPDCPVDDWHQPESERLIFDLLDVVQEKYNIDPEMILVTGYSLGGMGTWYYATYHNDIFSVAIPMASLPQSYIINNIDDIPVYVIQGMMDEIFDYSEVEAAVSQMEDRGVDVQLHGIAGLGHYTVEVYEEPLKRSIEWIRGNLGM